MTIAVPDPRVAGVSASTFTVASGMSTSVWPVRDMRARLARRPQTAQAGAHDLVPFGREVHSARQSAVRSPSPRPRTRWEVTQLVKMDLAEGGSVLVEVAE